MNKAQRVEKKRLKRKRKVAGKKTLVRGLQRSFKKQMVRIGRGVKPPEKVKKEKKPRVVKPYRIMRVQKQIEKLEAGVRALSHSDPNRQKMLNRLAEKRKLLGNKNYELSKVQDEKAN